MAPEILFNRGVGSVCYETSNDMSNIEPLCQILTPVGMLGYGFDETLTRKALQDLEVNLAPTALILDSGSTDGGPLKLAVGSMTTPRSAYERDFKKLMALSHEFHVPIIISSAGGDGADAHVDEFLNIIEEIADHAKDKHVLPLQYGTSVLIYLEPTDLKHWQSIAMYPSRRSSNLSPLVR
jgi:hypothetical protein